MASFGEMSAVDCDIEEYLKWIVGDVTILFTDSAI